MLQLLLIGAKRFAVLLPGIVIAYFSINNVYPFLDRRIASGLAIVATYGLGAYVLVPAIIRTYRILRPADHLPLYCVTPDGFASDPVNVGIIGTRHQLIEAMQKSGWHVADPHSFKNVIREMLSTIYGWSYPTAPVSSLYLFGRKQDVAFEIPIKGQPGSRHHVRFWATTYRSEQDLNIRTIDWHHRQEHVETDSLLWVGAASKDVGIGFVRHNLQITHMIDSDTNRERRLIVNKLIKAGLAHKVESIQLGEPYRLVNRVFRGSLHTDGRMDVVSLKH